jgi:hypothetical protein
MPDIGDIMDVNVEDLSPEQRQQLQDAVDQFQQKCLLLFKKNRSGVPYMKNEMPRVLLPWESDATTQQEREECMLLTPKFGKESDWWVRLDEESVWWKERFFQMYSAERSAVGCLLPFSKGTVELILRDWKETWLKQEGRMDG